MKIHWAHVLKYRLLFAVAAGIATFLVLPDTLHVALRLSAAWVALISAEFVIVFRTLGRRSNAELKLWAESVDLTGPAFPAFLILSAAAAVMASVFVLRAADGEQQVERYFHFALGASTVLSTWFAIQVAFAVRYAKMFYGSLGKRGEAGLRFPEDPTPDFYDFLYFATCAGMTFEASDVAVVSKHFRHWLTFHATFSFMFASINLALLVDIAANLI